MSVERATTAFAGLMVLLSVLLTYLVHPWFVALTVFVGLNLFQSAFTGFCPASMVLHKLGLSYEAELSQSAADVPPTHQGDGRAGVARP